MRTVPDHMTKTSDLFWSKKGNLLEWFLRRRFLETLLDKCDRINSTLSVTLGPVEQLGLQATDWVLEAPLYPSIN